MPMAHLGIMHRNNPIPADAFFQFGLSARQIHILFDQLPKQLSGCGDLLALGIIISQGRPYCLRQLHQALGIDHDSLQEHPAALLVIPVYLASTLRLDPK